MGDSERIKRLQSYHMSTLDMMLRVRTEAAQRAEKAAQHERQQCAELKCALLLNEFNLRLGMYVVYNRMTYLLAEADDSGNPVGWHLKTDGTPNPNDKISLFRYRLERIKRL